MLTRKLTKSSCDRVDSVIYYCPIRILFSFTSMISIIGSLWSLYQRKILDNGVLTLTILVTLLYELSTIISSILGIIGVTLLLPDAVSTPRNGKPPFRAFVWLRRSSALACLFLSLLCNSISKVNVEFWSDSRETLAVRYNRHYGNISIEDAIKSSEESAHDKNMTIYPLSTDKGEWFRERGFGRVVMIRAINLSGESKRPAGCQSQTDCLNLDPEDVTFVGRPFPLSSSDEVHAAKVHLARIRSWGFNALRFIVSWEAIEGRGPGMYDYEYLNYVRSVVKLCGTFGLGVIIDFHQDVWSRFTGGDGAPSWTLEAAGFNVHAIFESEAAIQSEAHPNISMLWPTNYERLATATMFTLFFAGNTFAPSSFVYDGKGNQKIPIQNYLQEHYFGAVRELVGYLVNETNVIGFDTLNEPIPGYVGMKDLHKRVFPAPLGWFLSPFQAMVVASGISLKVPKFCLPYVYCGMDELNPKNISAWKSVESDVWRNEGIWDINSTTGYPQLLRSNHFQYNKNGEEVDFYSDFMVPFYKAFANTVHEVSPNAIIFFEPVIDLSITHTETVHPDVVSLSNAATAPHFYDASALMLKKIFNSKLFFDVTSKFPIVIGERASQRAISRTLGLVKQSGTVDGQPALPVFIGEIGISMGMRDSFQTGRFISEALAFDRSMQALESNLLSFALWNYAPNNRNDKGDGWNGEDLSLFSADQYLASTDKISNIYSGGRAIEAVIRPYPIKTCGIPKMINFDAKAANRTFLYEFESISVDCNFCSSSPTIIFIPTFQYPNGIDCYVSDGSWQYSRSKQIMLYYADCSKSAHAVVVNHRSS